MWHHVAMGLKGCVTYVWKPLILTRHLPKFNDHRPCGSGDINYFTCHVTFQGNVTKWSCDSMEGCSLLYVTTLWRLVGGNRHSGSGNIMFLVLPRDPHVMTAIGLMEMELSILKSNFTWILQKKRTHHLNPPYWEVFRCNKTYSIKLSKGIKEYRCRGLYFLLSNVFIVTDAFQFLIMSDFSNCLYFNCC